ncbi:DUF6314 family protein [Sedimentitalea sp. HM32M-2]|uniref:DUF6314 family protein n=1 Tax=Sedimentitalea sp. HM32M-2 TaxID=3351566 RepID=UPI00363663CB
MRRPRRLSDFQGRWQLRRRIRHVDGARAEFTGLAEWQPCDAGLRQVETGMLRIAGQPAISASRCHVWHADLSVWFEDGRFFHTVPPMGGRSAHWCDPDQYEAGYDFSDWPRFRVTWRVHGPRKAYCMISRYRPQ